MDYSGNRFRRRFVGYDRSAVDMEFEKLLNQVDEEVGKNEQLKREIDDLKEERRDWEYAKRTLEEERTAISRDRASLAESVSSISSKVAELETNLSSAKVANEALQNKVDATTSEKNQLQLRLETVQERNRELTLRERQFDEIEKSVSSIMSVTKRATDRLFQKSVENQENVIRIAGDAAQEAAIIRADLTAARDDMNLAFDEFQDKIDKIDASLTGAVHKLVAIKHDSGLKPKNANATIESEVERLLSMRAGEIDYSDGKGYAVPVLGPYSSKFISDTAKKVNSGEIEGNPPSQQNSAQKEPSYARPDTAEEKPESKPIVKRSFPTNFESSASSIKEANKLLDDADDAAEQKNYIPLMQQPIPQQPVYQPVYNPFIATNCPTLNPALEIGDGITVNGVQSFIGRWECNFGKLMASDISAPYDEEIDHEYPYKSSITETVERRLARAVSTLEVLPSSIIAQVASEGKDWDTSGKVINYYGFGLPNDIGNYNVGQTYLNQSDGKLYTYGNGQWNYTAQLPSRWYQKVSTVEITDSGIEIKSTGSINLKAGSTINASSNNISLDENGNLRLNGTLYVNGNIIAGTFDAEGLVKQVASIGSSGFGMDNMPGGSWTGIGDWSDLGSPVAVFG